MVFGISNFWLFALTVLFINITPGATFVAVGSNAVTKGTRAGALTAAGAGIALLIYAMLCRAGLSTFIIHSPFLFRAIRYAGAAYLFYLAVKAYTQPTFDINRVHTKRNAGDFKKGLLVNLLNPFAPLLFLTLIPQFLPANGGTSTQVLFLGLWIVFSATMINLVWAFSFGLAGKYLISKPGFWKWQSRITGVLFLYLAIRFAFK